MKYIKIINRLRNDYVHGKNKISRNELLELYNEIYLNNNIKTFENMVSLLKQYEIITDYTSYEFLILEKSLYKFKEIEETEYISKIISKEFKDIKTIVWNTSILNEFTQHYVMNNYIIVETEKLAVEMILTLLKQELMKKYTIVTENMYNQNKNFFLNNEKVLIVKTLNSRAPLEKTNEGSFIPTIEKIMVDLYKDKIYEFYQGKELEYIYTNIFKSYSINFKKLYSYAKDRGNLEKYKDFIKRLGILDDI